MRLRQEDSKVKAHVNYATRPYFLPSPPNANRGGKKERMRRKRKERERS